MDIAEALLESWNRQCRIVMAVAGRVDDSNRYAKPSEDGWTLDHHLAHIHEVRREWISQVSPKHASNLGSAFTGEWRDPIQDLDIIRGHLDASAESVKEAFLAAMQNGAPPVGGYDHPVFFLQHMVWHEGWHVGLLFLGLRLAEQEPTQEWEEERVWGEWRTE